MNIEKFWVYPVFAIAAILGMSILSTGKHESYYVQQEASSTSIVYYCLYADVNWRTDPRIYCSEDITKVMMLYFGFKAQNEIKPEVKETPKKTEFKEESF